MRKRLTLAALVGLFLATAVRPADAGIFDWIDQLSGPGPFLGLSAEARVYCHPDGMGPRDSDSGGGVLLPCLFGLDKKKREDPNYTLNFGAGIAWALNNNLPYEDKSANRTVRLISLEPSAWWVVSPSVSLGVGTGLFIFTGPSFDNFARWVIRPVQVEIKPMAIRKRHSTMDEVLTIRTGYVWIPQGFTAADFGATGPFRTDREVLPTVTVLIDVKPLWRF